jgi:type I restriction enzyme M protein
LPVNYGLAPQYKHKRGEPIPFGLKKTSLMHLKNKFQRCHDIIWEGGKRDPATSFDEMSKLMFAKINDEVRATNVGDFYKFQIGTNESPAVIAKRIKDLYKNAQGFEPDVFKTEIELSDDLLFRVVSVLQDVSLVETDLDAKGQAFEHFIGKYFRGEYGQFFTPRQVIEFMIKVIDPTEEDVVIDPACGSGGFLLYVLNSVREKIAKRLVGDIYAIRDIQKDFALKRIFGIEVNDKIARVAMMDMVIHDDGHSNIECADALQDPITFDPRKQITLGKYTVCLTNPPFGHDVDAEKDYFDDYVFGKKIDKTRKGQKSEILFIERCTDLLKNNGRLGIILPDSAFSNLGNIEVCEYLFRNYKIKAVVSLPQFTFTPFGADAKTSILFAEKDEAAEVRFDQKKQLQERIKEIRMNPQLTHIQKKKAIDKEKTSFGKYDYPVFLAQIGKVGHDATGREDANYLGDLIFEMEKFQKDQLNYTNFYRDAEFWTVKVQFLDLADKLDVEAYSDEYFNIIHSIESSSADVKTLGQIADVYSGWNTPTKLQRTHGQIPLIKTSDVKKLIQTKDTVNGETIGVVDWNNIDSFVTLEEYVKRIDKQLVVNDILIQSVAHTRAYIADKIAIIDEMPKIYNGKAIALGKFLVVRIKNSIDVDPVYLTMFLASPQGKIQLKHFVRGMTAEIYERDIKEILVPLPKPEIQKQKGDEVRTIKETIIKHQQIIDSLKQQLLDVTKI